MIADALVPCHFLLKCCCWLCGSLIFVIFHTPFVSDSSTHQFSCLYLVLTYCAPLLPVPDVPDVPVGLVSEFLKTPCWPVSAAVAQYLAAQKHHSLCCRYLPTTCEEKNSVPRVFLVSKVSRSRKDVHCSKLLEWTKACATAVTAPSPSDKPHSQPLTINSPHLYPTCWVFLCFILWFFIQQLLLL